MPPLPELILGVLVPVAVSVVVLLTGFFVAKVRRKPQAWASPLAIAAGFFAGTWTVGKQVPQFQPFQSLGAVIWLGLAAAVGLGLLGKVRLPAVVRWIGVVLAGVVAMYFLKRPQLADYSYADAGILFASSAVILLAWQLVWERIALAASDDTPRPTAALALTVVASGVAILLLMSGSQFLGRVGGTLAAAIGPVFLLAVYTDRTPLARAGVFIASLLTLGMLMAGVYYADVRLAHAALVLASPVFVVPTFYKPLNRWAGWKRALLVTFLAFLPIAAALAWAAPTFIKSIDESPDSLGY